MDSVCEHLEAFVTLRQRSCWILRLRDHDYGWEEILPKYSTCVINFNCWRNDCMKNLFWTSAKCSTEEIEEWMIGWKTARKNLTKCRFKGHFSQKQNNYSAPHVTLHVECRVSKCPSSSASFFLLSLIQIITTHNCDNIAHKHWHLHIRLKHILAVDMTRST